MFRAICELVQTGSMLFSATCGTMDSVCEPPAMAGRAASVGMDVRAYRKAIMKSQARLRALKNQQRAVDGRFYEGQPNWKLILTSRTARAVLLTDR